MDFDNDGLKDLFISNGIPKRMNDMDYVNFVSNSEVQQKLRENKMNEKDMALVNKFPEIKIPNRFFRNKGNLQFENIDNQVLNAPSTYSNGAIYADLDNDGDLDVVVNNIDDPVEIYENTSNDNKSHPSASIRLKGPAKNLDAIGSKIIVFADNGIRTYENYPVKGFMSSMLTPMYIGLYHTKIDSAFLIWPDNSYQSIQLRSGNQSFVYKPGLPLFDYKRITTHWKNETRPMQDITLQTGLSYVHKENPFIEFDREPLIPHMISTEGPALAVADINHDGLEDVFVGSSKTFHNAVFLQQPSGRFVQMHQPDMEKDSMYEDVDAKWIDVNKDGNVDLVVCTGGNEYYGNDEHLLPRVYLNDGKGNLKKLDNAFNDLYFTFSCIVPCDLNHDGYPDLFLGGRAVPWGYGQTPPSYFLLNDGSGKFKDVTSTYAPELKNEGMVTSAIWTDINNDGQNDLVVCSEWGTIDAFINTNGKFNKKVLSNKKGFWNFIYAADLNHDGKTDLIAGNLGLNSRLKASDEEPVRLYVNDFDDNGKKEQVLSYYLNGKEIPFANKDELQKQIPILKKKFLYAQDFAKATMEDIFNADKLKNSQTLTANYLSNAILINKGNLQFETIAMPWEAQLSSYRSATVIDANKDSLPDILLGGNYYDNNIQMGRYDADYGTILVNKGNGHFVCESINGMAIKGQIRHILPITINNKVAYVLARNNDSLKVISFR
jgi:ASPIC and UnbV.